MHFSPELLARHLAALTGAGLPARLALAVSGGADSAALAMAAAALAAGAPALQLRALHIDHGLTPAAAALAAAATELAMRLGMALEIIRVTVPPDGGEGIEAAARRARYAALGAALAPGECLLTAHHLEDQAETLLLQLLRGTGLKGLAAMPAAAPLGRGRLLRPLLAVPRQALRDYASAHALPSVEDPMNGELRFDRAYLRSALWPALTARWPEAAAALARAAGHAASAQRLIDAATLRLLTPLRRGPALELAALRALERDERAAVLRGWLAGQRLPVPSAARIAQIERELLNARDGAQPCLRWPGIELHRFAGLVYAFAPLAAQPLAGAPLPAQATELALGELGRLELAPGGAGSLRLGPGYRFADRAGGERLRLAAGAQRRALKDLLREARLPPWARERALLIAGESLAAVVLPHATWVAAEYAAHPGEAALALAWRDAPAVLLPAPLN